MNLAVLVVVVLVAAIVFVAIVFRIAWRVAEPDEALIVSGFRTSERPDGVGESMGFRIVTGRGCLVAPGLTKVRSLSLEAHESQISVPCVSKQKIGMTLMGVVVYKIGDDYRSIANAARRFLDRPAEELETKVQNVFVGHLRAIAGSMTIEDMISDQDMFSQQVRDRCSQEMESFGLVIDSFQIQGVTERVELHREPRRSSPGRGRAERPHRPGQRRTRGSRAGADGASADRRIRTRYEHQKGGLPGRSRQGDARG